MIRVFEHIGDHERRDAGLCRLLELVDAERKLIEEGAVKRSTFDDCSFDAPTPNVAPSTPE